jgi:hypothetical protein
MIAIATLSENLFQLLSGVINREGHNQMNIVRIDQTSIINHYRIRLLYRSN